MSCNPVWGHQAVIYLLILFRMLTVNAQLWPVLCDGCLETNTEHIFTTSATQLEFLIDSICKTSSRREVHPFRLASVLNGNPAAECISTHSRCSHAPTFPSTFVSNKLSSRALKTSPNCCQHSVLTEQQPASCMSEPTAQKQTKTRPQIWSMTILIRWSHIYKTLLSLKPNGCYLSTVW